VRRPIASFRQDEAGDWVAELKCLHRQHVRHQPPFRLAPWVLDAGGRNARRGTPLDCPLCDRLELPDGLETDRVTDTWTDATMPQALRRDHRVAGGRWALLHVVAGAVRYRAATEPPTDVLVRPGSPQPIPPEVAHSVEGAGPASFFVEFLRPQSA